VGVGKEFKNKAFGSIKLMKITIINYSCLQISRRVYDFMTVYNIFNERSERYDTTVTENIAAR